MADYGEDVWENDMDDNEEELEDESITAEDCWTVISSFFAKKGLVSQQIDSFDEFVTTTVQSLMDEYSTVSLDLSVVYVVNNAPRSCSSGAEAALLAPGWW